MIDLLAGVESEKALETRVNADLALGNSWNGLGIGINKQAQIPSRRSLDETPALDISLRQFLLVDADQSQTGELDVVAFRGVNWVWERDAVELVLDALKPWLLCRPLKASLPCGVGLEQYALDGVGRDAKLLTVVRQQVLEHLLGEVDFVSCVEFYFAYSEIPDGAQHREPR